jgi:hypothetical protein
MIRCLFFTQKVHSTHSDKAYQLLAHGRWFCPGTPASSTTKTGRHDIAVILLKMALSTKNQSINHFKICQRLHMTTEKGINYLPFFCNLKNDILFDLHGNKINNMVKGTDIFSIENLR